MCDYSLHNVNQRLAVEGEPLQVYKFPSGSLGLASPAELRPTAISPQGRTNWWQTIKAWFSVPPPVCAVCVPPGARLVLRDVPQSLQQRLGVGTEEEVTFVQLRPELTGYRDAVRFQNGKEILLQQLPVGLEVDVLGFSDSAERMPQLLEVNTQDAPRVRVSV
jgi:hypothetical protein